MLRILGTASLALLLVACVDIDGVIGAGEATTTEPTASSDGSDDASLDPDEGAATTTAATTAAELASRVTEVCELGELSAAPAIDDVALLADRQGVTYCLGPALLTGGIDNASVGATESGFLVGLVFTHAGIADFNAAAALCAPTAAENAVCPTGRLAIVIDHVVASAPVIQAAGFERDQITISGDFTAGEAEALAESLRTIEPSFRPVLAEVARPDGEGG